MVDVAEPFGVRNRESSREVWVGQRLVEIPSGSTRSVRARIRCVDRTEPTGGEPGEVEGRRGQRPTSRYSADGLGTETATGRGGAADPAPPGNATPQQLSPTFLERPELLGRGRDSRGISTRGSQSWSVRVHERHPRLGEDLSLQRGITVTPEDITHRGQAARWWARRSQQSDGGLEDLGRARRYIHDAVQAPPPASSIRI